LDTGVAGIRAARGQGRRPHLNYFGWQLLLSCTTASALARKGEHVFCPAL